MPLQREFTLALADDNYYDLSSKGPMDEDRHRRKIEEAIKGNLQDIVTQENIITSDGQKIVRIPIRDLRLPRFKYDDRQYKGTGSGDGDSGIGDIIGQQPGTGPGKGKQAGNMPGVDYYEVGISIDDLAAVLFKDFELPDLTQKRQNLIMSETVEFRDVRKKGLMPNLDKRRTILENIRRNAAAGNPHFGDIKDDDLRFKTWDEVLSQQTSAVVIAMRDVSGSMGEFEKYITRSFYFWMIRFLRTKYQNVEMVFITHHTEAKEVDEQAFFNLGESGGTRVSSAYKLSLDIIDGRYPKENWNIYPFHASDGDNWGDTDNNLSADLVRKHFNAGANMFGYLEIVEGNRGWSSRLMSMINTINDPRVRKALVTERKDVYPALQTFFARGDKVAA